MSGRSVNAAVASAGPERAATIFCIMIIKRFWSALLRPPTVSRWASLADFSILRSSAAPAGVKRQVCDRHRVRDRTIDKATGLQSFKRPCCRRAIERDVRGQRRLIGGSPVASAVSRLYCSGVISKAAHFSWNKATWIWCSRRIRYPGRSSSGHGLRLRACSGHQVFPRCERRRAALHEFEAVYAMNIGVRKYEVYFAIGRLLECAADRERRSAMSVSTSFDLLLRGGRVIDPASGVDGLKDVAVRNGKIAVVQSDILPRAPGRSSMSLARSCCRG